MIMDALHLSNALTTDEILKIGLQIDTQIAELQRQRTTLVKLLDLRFPLSHATEILRSNTLTCRRKVSYQFRFSPNGLPQLKHLYGNMAAQLVTPTALVPTAKFRDILARADNDDSTGLRKYVTVTQFVDFSFNLNL